VYGLLLLYHLPEGELARHGWMNARYFGADTAEIPLYLFLKVIGSNLSATRMVMAGALTLLVLFVRVIFGYGLCQSQLCSLREG
jgi:hypothetical protein